MAGSLRDANRQTAAANLEALSNIGTGKGDFTNILTPIEDAAASFIERVVRNIESEGMINTGAIANLTIQLQDQEVLIYGPLHLIFQDKGVNGALVKNYDTPFSYKEKMPPWQVFRDYINSKNINLRNEEKYTRKKGKGSPFAALDGDDKDIEQAARGMAYAVWAKGFRPRAVYSKEIAKLISDIQAAVPTFAASKVISSINALPPSTITVIL
jgi:hypothetical protein